MVQMGPTCHESLLAHLLSTPFRLLLLSYVSEQNAGCATSQRQRGWYVYWQQHLTTAQDSLASVITSAVTPCVTVFKQTFCSLYLGVH